MIILECGADEFLARHLTGLTRRQIVHELKGKGGVTARLRRQNNSKGLVDEDPGSPQPRYLGEMNVSSDLPELGLKVLRHAGSGNVVVVVRPRLEEWMLDAAKAVGVDARDHGLPSRPTALKRVIDANPTKLAKLLAALGAARSERLNALRRLLTEQS